MAIRVHQDGDQSAASAPPEVSAALNIGAENEIAPWLSKSFVVRMVGCRSAQPNVRKTVEISGPPRLPHSEPDGQTIERLICYKAVTSG
jgi:hypothetical protein